MSSSQTICAATTLTATLASLGSAALLGSWSSGKGDGSIVVRLKHTKHGSQSGGYPVVRARWTYTNVADTERNHHDPIYNSTITVSTGVATIDADVAEITVTGLTDSDGTIEYPLTFTVPPYAEKITLWAKQAGDTTNFGTLAAELTGRI